MLVEIFVFSRHSDVAKITGRTIELYYNVLRSIRHFFELSEGFLPHLISPTSSRKPIRLSLSC